jgi:hypothetical protein
LQRQLIKKVLKLLIIILIIVICIIPVLWSLNNSDTVVEELQEVQKPPEIIILSNEDKIRAVFEPFVTAQDYYDVSHECSVNSSATDNLACNIKGIGLLSIPTDILLTTFEGDELLFCKLFDEATRTTYYPGDSLLLSWMDQSQKQEFCIAALGTALMDLSVCDKSKMNFECYNDIAKKSDMVTLKECNTLELGIGKCYSAVAARTDDSSICEFDEGDHVEFSKEYNYKNNCLSKIENLK